MLTDGDIRAALVAHIIENLSDTTQAIGVHEFSISNGFGYADVAVVNGELVGYEIKSDVDSLARLPRQVSTFSSVFDRMWLVTTARHEANATALIPKWWGVLVADGLCTRLSKKRAAKRNGNVNVPLVLDLLYRDDLSRLATDVGCRGHSRLSKAALCHLIASRIRQDVARNRVREVLYEERRYQSDRIIFNRPGSVATVEEKLALFC